MKRLLPLLFLFLLVCGIFYPTINGLHPFPGNYLLAWYEPWRTDHTVGGTIVLAHKPVLPDVFRQTYPFKVLAAEMLKHLQVPLWNPYNGAGQPLLATNNIGLLDPLNIFYFLTTSPYAWTISIIVQTLLLGLFTYLLCRTWGLTQYASSCVVVALLFSGVVMTHLPYGIFGLGYAMLPLGLYILSVWGQNTKSKIIYLLPLCIFILVVSILPQLSIATLVVFLFYCSLFLSRERVVIPIGFMILGLGLSAMQLLPTGELFTQANMTTVASKFIFKEFLLPITHFVSVLIPNYFGNAATYNFWEKTDYVETAFALGLIPVFLSIMGLRSREMSRRTRIFLLSLIGIPLLLIIQSPISQFIASLPIPILSTSAPTRFFFFATFGLAILAGYGIDALVLHAKKKEILKYLGIYCGIILAIVLITGYVFVKHFPCGEHIILTCRSVALRNTLLEVGVFAVFLLALSAFLWKKQLKKWLYVSTILLISGIGWYNTQKFLPWSPTSSFLPRNQVVRELQSRTDGRVLGFDHGGINTDFATYFHYFDPDYYHPLYIKRYGELVAYGNADMDHKYELLRADVEVNNHATESATFTLQRDRLLDLLSVKYLLFKKSDLPLSTGDHPIWQNSDWYLMEHFQALPHAYFVDRSVTKTSDKEVLKKLFDPFFDLHETVVLEGKTNRETFTNAKGTVSIRRYGENSIVLSVDANGSGYIVLTDNYYPGWKAYVDGQEVPVLRANYTFRAVPVPAGRHVVKFTYNPLSFKIGLGISAGSLLLLVLLFLRHRHY